MNIEMEVPLRQVCTQRSIITTTRRISSTRSSDGVTTSKMTHSANVTIMTNDDHNLTQAKTYKMGEHTDWTHDNRTGVSTKEVKTYVGDDGEEFELDLGDPKDKAIYDTLMKVQSTFLNMIDAERSNFMEMYPQFKKLRSAGDMFDSAPIEVETYTEGDKIITIEKKAMRASHKITSTVINGVVQKQNTRAFVEYSGPDGKYKLRLTHGGGTEAVDDEDTKSEVDDAESDADRRSVAASELLDEQSAVAVYKNKEDMVPVLEVKPRGGDSKLNKAWLAAKELVDTEERYVNRLQLLDDFRRRVMEEKVLNAKEVAKVFSNLHSLYVFHHDHLLVQLLERRRDWNTTQRISDVMCKLGPYLKLYAEYATNFDTLPKTYQHLMHTNSKFAAVANEMQERSDCGHLPLNTHLVEPVQRIMRYHMLLEAYLKYLPANHVDLDDTKKAHALCKTAAEHSDAVMKKSADYKDVMAIQEQLGTQLPGLVAANRMFIKKGQLTKISARSNEHQPRYIFLLSDMLLVCSARGSALKTVTKSALRLRNIVAVNDMQICEGDRLDVEHSFYIRSSRATIELYANDDYIKGNWLTALSKAIQAAKGKPAIPNGVQPSPANGASNGVVDPPPSPSTSTSCTICHHTFSPSKRQSLVKFMSPSNTKKPITCIICGKIVCRKCASAKRRSSVDGAAGRVCDICKTRSTTGGGAALSAASNNNSANNVAVDNGKSSINPVGSLLDIKAREDGIYSGYLILNSGQQRKPVRRYFVIRANLVMYSYHDIDSQHAVAMLPLPGCRTSSDSLTDTKSTTFKIDHMNRVYFLNAITRDVMAKWMAVLDLAANAQLAQEAQLSP